MSVPRGRAERPSLPRGNSIRKERAKMFDCFDLEIQCEEIFAEDEDEDW